MMRVIIERCCGLDVHQETVVACLLIGAPGDRPTKEVRTFRTVTRDLEVLRDWLAAAGVTHVGMESTGVYWRPVYAVLEGHFDLIVRQRSAHPQRAGAQDGREGCRVDRRSGPARADRKELRAAPATAGNARAVALPPQAHREPSGRAQPAAEASGNGQHQAGARHPIFAGPPGRTSGTSDGGLLLSRPGFLVTLISARPCRFGDGQGTPLLGSCAVGTFDRIS